MCCVPFSAESIYALNIETGEVKKKLIDPPQSGFEEYNSMAKFMSAFSYENKVFMVGVSYPAIVEYDIEKNELIYHDAWFRELCVFFKTDDSAIFRKTMAVDSKIYAPSCKGNIVLEFSMETYNYHIYQVGDELCNFSAICYDGESFWLAPRDSDGIVEWNKDTKETNIYNNYPAGFIKRDYSFNDIIVTKNKKIILLPGSANMFLTFDENKNICEYENKIRNYGNVSGCKSDNGIQYLFSMKQEALFKIENGCVDSSFIHFHINDLELAKGTKLFKESVIDSLDKYISFTPADSGYKNNGRDTGYQIWATMKEF